MARLRNISTIIGLGGVPIGTIVPFAGSSAPSGWLICDGAEISRTTYADLFAIIHTLHGAGNGSTTFNLPDLRKRAPLGKGTGNVVGENDSISEGSRSLTHSHTTPNHSHTVNAHSHSTPAHSHTVNAHSHSTPAHSHTVNAHSHSTPAHSHIIPIGFDETYIFYYGNSSNFPFYGSTVIGPVNMAAPTWPVGFSTGLVRLSHTDTSGAGTTGTASPSTDTSGAGTTGTASPSTDTSGAGTTGTASPSTNTSGAGTTGTSTGLNYLIVNYIIKY